MDQEEKILEALANLTAAVQKGFSDMSGRFEAIEDRLDRQEKKARKTAQRQQLQAAEIAELKEAVRGLAEREPLRIWPDAAAIRKESAYREFEERGVGKLTALRALQKDGTIRAGSENKRTQVIRVDGDVRRVIVVTIEEGKERKAK